MRIAPIVPEGAKVCSRCRKVKPTGAFYRDRRAADGATSWCRTCKRIEAGERYRSDDYHARRAAYLARPDVLARKREAGRRWALRNRPATDRYRDTARYRLLDARRKAVGKLAAATDPARRAWLLALVAAHERELARIDAAAGLVPRWRPVGATTPCCHLRGADGRRPIPRPEDPESWRPTPC